VVLALARSAGFEVAGFVDMHCDAKSAPENAEVCGVRVIGGMASLQELGNPSVALAIGNNHDRLRTAATIRAALPGVDFPVLVHATAKIEADATIGEGSQICIGAIVCARASIGSFVIINSGSIVDHEDVIEEGSHISPGARLAGRVRVGRCTHVGIGATVIEKVTIGSDSIVGGGAVVLKDVPANTTAVGVPVRHIPRASTSHG